jgi:Fungal specific transcription factor domain
MTAEWVWFTMRGAYFNYPFIYYLTCQLNSTRALGLHYTNCASIQTTHVQCLILMSSFLYSVNCLPQAWLFVGQAIRTAQDLGLHVSCFNLHHYTSCLTVSFSDRLAGFLLHLSKRKLVARSGGVYTPSTGCVH